MTPREERVSLALGAGAMTAVALIVGLFATSIERRNCLQRWQGSAVAARHNWRLGCQVQSPHFGWVPEANFNARNP
jgi:hypothetical protein